MKYADSIIVNAESVEFISELEGRLQLEAIMSVRDYTHLKHSDTTFNLICLNVGDDSVVLGGSPSFKRVNRKVEMGAVVVRLFSTWATGPIYNLPPSTKVSNIEMWP